MQLDPSLGLEQSRAVWMGTNATSACLDLSWRRYVQNPALLFLFITSGDIRGCQVGALGSRVLSEASHFGSADSVQAATSKSVIPV